MTWTAAVQRAKRMAVYLGNVVAIYDMPTGYLVCPLLEGPAKPRNARPHLGRPERLIVGRIGKEMCTW